MKQRTILVALFVTLSSLSFISIPLSVTAQLPSGDLTSDLQTAMEPRDSKSSYYNEFWTYHIILDNGVRLIYSFTISDFGSYKDRVTGLKHQLTWTNDKTYVIRKEYDPKTFIYDPEQNLIDLHPERNYRAYGRPDSVHTLYLETKKKGHEFYTKLELYDMADPQIWGNGNFYVQGKQISLSFPIPHAKVRGDIALDGDTLKNVSGVAYMDHIHQTDLGSKIFKEGYEFKTGDSQNGMVVNIIKPRKTDQLIGYGIAYKDGKVSLLKPISIDEYEQKKVRGQKYARKMKFNFADHPSFSLQIDEIYHDYSILDELGGMTRFFAKKVLGGEVIEFNGKASSTDTDNYIYFNNFVTE